MSRKSHIGNRDWNKRPLFGARRRRYAHWWIIGFVVCCGILLFLFPNLVNALLTPLFT